MRTTVTLDPALHHQLEEYARERHASFKDAINEVLRRGLMSGDGVAPPRFVVEPHPSVFVPGVDPARLNQLLDELDVDDFAIKAKR